MKIEHYDNLGAPRTSQELPGALKNPQEPPDAPKTSRKLQGAPRNSHELSGALRGLRSKYLKIIQYITVDGKVLIWDNVFGPVRGGAAIAH